MKGRFAARCLGASLVMAGCQAQRGAMPASEAKEAAQATAPGRAFVPEDLIVLFPIAPAIWKNKSSDAALNTALVPALVQLSSLMKKEVYTKLLAGATASADDANPLNDPELANATKSIPHANWSVVSMRFRPCVTSLPMPESWMKRPLTGGGTLAQATCRPRVQVVAQPFGIAKGATPSQGTTDDKAIHILYDFAGTAADSDLQSADQAENAAKAALEQALATGPLTFDAAAAAITANYTAKVRTTIAKTRQDLINVVKDMRAADGAGDLRIPYGPQSVLPKYRGFLREVIAKSGLPREITQTFATTGKGPGFGQQWLFASYVPTRKKGALLNAATTLTKRKLTFVADAANGTAIPHDAGFNEFFFDSLGQTPSIDPEVQTALTASPENLQQSLIDTGGVFFAQAKDGQLQDQQAILTVQTSPKFLALKPSLIASLTHINTAASHAAQMTSCLSCHVATGLRERLKFDVPMVKKLAGNRDTTKTGPFVLNQVTLTTSWNLRMLGYFGQAPSIGDRVQDEAKADVAVANAIMAGGF